MMRILIHSVVLSLAALGGALPAHAAGDAEQGKALYALCAACHGPNAEGMAALNAPANAGQDPWYMTRQLKNFKAGIRGAHPDDAFGAQMRPMARAAPMVSSRLCRPPRRRQSGNTGQLHLGSARHG